MIWEEFVSTGVHVCFSPVPVWIDEMSVCVAGSAVTGGYMYMYISNGSYRYGYAQVEV